MAKQGLYEVTVKFYVEADSVDNAKYEAIVGMDEGSIAIGDDSFVNVKWVEE